MPDSNPSQASGPAQTAPAPRFIIGIDLGTTNCALAYIDTSSREGQAQILEIPQWDYEGSIVKATTLPSFYYLPPKAEWKRGQLTWPVPPAAAPEPVEAQDYAVGRIARLKSSQVPGRVIHAAKSWLCHAGVDPTARILPWHIGDLVGEECRSPVEVSAAYLLHLRRTWNDSNHAADPASRFELQDVIITVPASFDEVAQRLTLAAAELAGYNQTRLRLLEEPQAAFYHWLACARKRRRATQVQGNVLILDVGGGTSDFSLFNVTPPTAATDAPRIERTAVSDHVLLGGDNIDLSLAHRLEERLVGVGKKLSSRQWAQLVFATRQLKEKALADSDVTLARDCPDLHVSIAGDGASLFATAMTASISQKEILELVLGGFFPQVERTAQPQRPRSALLQLGLPYAHDSALTKHLAAFLRGQDVDAVLFTGGTLKPAAIQELLLEQITSWQGRRPEALAHDDMELAVALGAAAYGAALRRPQDRILGGYPRSLYLVVGDGELRQLLCIVPQGFDGVTPLAITDLGLKLRTGHPVRFQIMSSNRRSHDQSGDLVAFDATAFHPLPPLDTRLESSLNGDAGLVDVRLEGVLASTGLFHLYCIQHGGSSNQRWQLNFNTRATRAASAAPCAEAAATTPAVCVASAKTRAVQDIIASYYGKKKPGSLDIMPAKNLVRELEGILDQPRDDWATPFLRALWPTLEEGITRRSRSVGHEATWLYLAGFILRPGYGYELDEWRLAALWRVFELGLAFPKEKQIEEQWWLMWRRVAGGLNKIQQERIFDRIFPALRKNAASSGELYMLAGSLERIDMGQKIRLGQQLVQQIVGGRQQFVNQRMWALARIASRVPLYGGAEAIVRPEVVGAWFRELRSLKRQDPAFGKLALFLSQAGRMVLDREFDLAEPLRAEFLQHLTLTFASAEQTRVVREFVAVDSAARTLLFGESLPAGLVLG